jgi:hypothetical protein
MKWAVNKGKGEEGAVGQDSQAEAAELRREDRNIDGPKFVIARDTLPFQARFLHVLSAPSSARHQEMDPFFRYKNLYASPPMNASIFCHQPSFTSIKAEFESCAVLASPCPDPQSWNGITIA